MSQHDFIKVLVICILSLPAAFSNTMGKTLERMTGTRTVNGGVYQEMKVHRGLDPLPKATVGIDNRTPNKEKVLKKKCRSCYTEISPYGSSSLCSPCESRKRSEAQRRRK